MTARTRTGTGLVRDLSGTWWAMTALLALCFALGGSARGDVVQLIALRPLAMLLLGYGLWTLKIETVKQHRFLWAMAGAIVALPALQLVPLPPQLWHQLPGRDLVVEIDRVAGLGSLWRPLSLTPVETSNALYASLVPLAVFVLGAQLTPEERFRLLPPVLLLGGTSALLGLLQLLGDPNGPLYLFPITNNGSAVGLFANRNHQAVLLAMMLPMLAVLAAGHDPLVKLVAWLAGFVLLPLILITGSRSGLLVAGLGLMAIPFIVPMKPAPGDGLVARLPRQLRSPTAVRLAMGGAGLALASLTIWLGRGEAWNRLFAGGGEGDLRVRILPTLLAMIAKYMPVGAGMGSFERVYQVHEPDDLLDPDYMNHAHNDWLEVLLDGGAVAAVLLVIAVLAFALRAWRTGQSGHASSQDQRFTRLGLVLAGLAGAASATDYPLRTPAHAALFTLAVLWTGFSLPQGRPLVATSTGR